MNDLEKKELAYLLALEQKQELTSDEKARKFVLLEARTNDEKGVVTKVAVTNLPIEGHTAPSVPHTAPVIEVVKPQEAPKAKVEPKVQTYTPYVAPKVKEEPKVHTPFVSKPYDKYSK